MSGARGAWRCFGRAVRFGGAARRIAVRSRRLLGVGCRAAGAPAAPSFEI
ncbi:hypothetical protein BMASAVP1_A1298 [Burkholderia mallei SAVP1]|nr:hypothetical protein BMASAVP1_A1298 [Burkholderia mallei SAVP1]